MHDEYITAKMALLTYGYKFSELMQLADAHLIRRRHRRSADGDDIYTFARADIVRYADVTHGDDDTTQGNG